MSDIENIKATIAALDLECVKYKLVTEDGWPLEKADHVEKHYKAFLFACAAQPEYIAIPSKEVDDFWHVHILDTHKYHADCDAILGRYLHHYPYVGLFSDDDPVLTENYARTRATIIQAFGIDPAVSWEDQQSHEA